MIITCPWCKKTIDTDKTGGPGEHISSCEKMPPPAGSK